MAFEQRTVLWSELIAEWQLTNDEVAYIERQQGHICVACQSNLRSRTLAAALLDYFGFTGNLREFCMASRQARSFRLLELNEAGSLSSWLSHFRRHTLASYPEVDMQALPYHSESWEIILHSDVLEHVPNPLQGLRECHRILVTGGVLIYTIPIVFGRLTRTRQGLTPSHHGAPGQSQQDWMVQTEYGADFWRQPIEAGFKKISIFTLDGPESLALVCEK
ncbi:MAG: methyltransferase domain-containing protein [Sulfuricella sp.]|nr:methyltransferase domain-containing protein [Sulfuricella sp.]